MDIVNDKVVQMLATLQLATFNVDVAQQRYERGTHHDSMPCKERTSNMINNTKRPFPGKFWPNNAILFYRIHSRRQ
jgi:hypothetical protein